MTIALQIAGTSFTGWQEVEIRRSMDALAGTFQLKISGSVQNQFPIRRGSPVKILIDNTVILTGYVDKIKVDYSAQDHALTIVGRDRACDLIDSTVDGKFSFNQPAGLAQVVRSMLKTYGITGLTVIDRTDGIDPFVAEDVVAAHLGISVFEALESYCRLRQVFMITNGDGNIVLVQGGEAADSGVKLAHLVPGNGPSNILSACIDIDDSCRFNRYICWSQGNPSQIEDVTLDDGDPGADPADIATRTGDATDTQIRTQRVLNFSCEHAAGGKVGNTKGKRKKLKKGQSEDIYDRATWEANIRRIRSLTYTATVQGHTKTGKADPWQIFETVPVRDDFANLNAVLMIKETKFTLDLTSGSRTELILVSQDSYTLQAEEDQRVALANKAGPGFGPSIDFTQPVGEKE